MITRRGFLNTMLISLVIIFASQPLLAASPMEGTHSKDADGLAWLYDSPLTVFEEITPIGGGLYKYSYSFSNTDSNHIWHFAVFTNFEVLLPATSFSEFPLWNTSRLNVQYIEPTYDPRNIDPNIIGAGNTWLGYEPSHPNPDNPIPPETFVEGFSFIGTELNPNPKYYLYETVESGYAQYTGFVAAVGLTETGVVATQESTWDEVKSLYR